MAQPRTARPAASSPAKPSDQNTKVVLKASAYLSCSAGIGGREPRTARLYLTRTSQVLGWVISPPHAHAENCGMKSIAGILTTLLVPRDVKR
jgi:hypothetical protein